MTDLLSATLVSFLLATPLLGAEHPVTSFPPPFDSSDWTRLLEKHVDDRGLVSYASWKKNAADSRALDVYLAKFAAPGGSPSADEKVALLANAYNAFIARTILEHYPIAGIRSIPGAFTAESHGIGGEKYSLDEIEHTAVALGGYRVHAILVCASKSCPPLDRRAYSAEGLSAREDDRLRAWMSRSDLYRFEPEKNLAKLPMYFDWYRADFEKPGVVKVLSAYAPSRYRAWLARGGFRIEYMDYDWTLNELSSR